jgi:hypothetical protein
MALGQSAGNPVGAGAGAVGDGFGAGAVGDGTGAAVVGGGLAVGAGEGAGVAQLKATMNKVRTNTRLAIRATFFMVSLLLFST